ncbi:MAG: class I SAM-dependent methyltransferase [Candidatus Doudnabacteria bacterium]|nr:class I SAM-dependent methyltransferase [Candidatus Doudnabacteria bacterium]
MIDTITTQTTWDYTLLDSGTGRRLEQWGQYRLIRPDPQAIWQPHLHSREWSKADASFEGRWQLRTKSPKQWEILFPLPLNPGESVTGDWTLRITARLTPFKHTGIFAEQAANWEWLKEQVAYLRTKTETVKPRILNLFGYTGAATALLAKLSCSVTHVDASKPAIVWAKENQSRNALAADSVRWILDDALKFVKREVKRGSVYDGILMDPPAFGHAPDGKTWKFADDFPRLLTEATALLSPDASFLLVNAYATNSSALALHNVMQDLLPPKGTLQCGELCLQQQDGRLLSTGIVGRWNR